MFSRNARQRFLQIIFWNYPGRWLVRFIHRYLGPRWDGIVMNRSLNSPHNGEYWLIDLLPSEPLIFDVGFNKGEFSAEVLRRRPAARSIGFDPAGSMKTNFEASYPHRDRVELVSAAISNRRGEAWFVDSADGVSHLATEAPTPGAYAVPIICLDDFAAERGLDKIDFLKIDAEGYDPHVLEGSEGLLKAGKIDLLMFEYNEPWIHSKRFLLEVWEFFQSKPYKLFSLYNGFLSPFVYSHRAERHDIGINYVAVSNERLARGGIKIRNFP